MVVKNEINISQSGMKALQAGDAAKARLYFEAATQAGDLSIETWIGYAKACKQLKDSVATLAAVNQILKLDPRNISGLLMKGDHYHEQDDLRAASAHYGMAIKLANIASALTPDLVADIDRAKAKKARFVEAFFHHLEASLKMAGYNAATSSKRFTYSLEMLQGKKQRQVQQQQYVQMPHTHFFPGLPLIQFFPAEDFVWVEKLEAATDDICQELLALLKHGDDDFEAYIQSNPNRPQKTASELIGNKDWSSCYLWENGSPVPEMIDRFPKTMAALEEVSMTNIKGYAPSILFSRLEPGAKILPHTGLLNSRLICHLPLIVPNGCGLRVGDESREFEKGKVWIFDDSINHEAWNSSDKMRIILLFEIWRPEMTEEECKLVAALLEAVNNFGKDNSAIA